MKSRALTKPSKCKYYTKNGRKNVTSDRSTTKCEFSGVMQSMSRHAILPRAFGKDGRNCSMLCAETFMKKKKTSFGMYLLQLVKEKNNFSPCFCSRDAVHFFYFILFFCNLITVYFSFLPYNNNINFYIHYRRYNFLKKWYTNNSHTHAQHTRHTTTVSILLNLNKYLFHVFVISVTKFYWTWEMTVV